ncbi:MAG: hypothetical protein ACK53P_12090 [Pseudanabaena sp.]
MWSGQFCVGDELVDLIVDLVIAGTRRSLAILAPEIFLAVGPTRNAAKPPMMNNSQPCHRKC